MKIGLKKYNERYGSPLLGTKKDEQHKDNMKKSWTIERKKELSNKMKICNPMTNTKTKEKMRISLIEYYKENDGTFKNKTHSKEAKDKISKANKGRIYEKKECPHCKTLVGGPNTNRYHFDNCKSNPNRNNTGYKKPAYKKIKCPHCSKISIISNIKRYHFDNCKDKK